MGTTSVRSAHSDSASRSSIHMRSQCPQTYTIVAKVLQARILSLEASQCGHRVAARTMDLTNTVEATSSVATRLYDFGHLFSWLESHPCHVTVGWHDKAQLVLGPVPSCSKRS